MTMGPHRPQSRRAFIADVGTLGVTAAALTACASGALHAAVPGATSGLASAPPDAADSWDLSWTTKLTNASDRALFDSPEIGGGLALEVATRFLDNCDAAYGAGRHTARAVVNLRGHGIAIALDDSIWARYRIGAEYEVQDPDVGYDPMDPGTWKPALKNPFIRADRRSARDGLVDRLVERGAIVLVCDFTLGRTGGENGEEARMASTGSPGTPARVRIGLRG